MSQLALSARVAKLVAEYQVKLLERRTSRVVPTAAGCRLLERLPVRRFADSSRAFPTCTPVQASRSATAPKIVCCQDLPTINLMRLSEELTGQIQGSTFRYYSRKGSLVHRTDDTQSVYLHRI
ncbi:LysR family transcriptional regulator [Bradyrhizobium sp. I71]|uniref:LysR family transcriptional regulator n=1 Tax=Bradyrhizobium sp. I71 TaxID=2590772 RepID=UPI001EF86051|nr:LysR family transcriptional regulator [Bradyrhizobium sp. I71]